MTVVVEGSGGVLKVPRVVPFQDIPDPVFERKIRLMGRENRLFSGIQPDTPDAFCDEQAVFRTGIEDCRIEVGDFFPSPIVFFVEKGIVR